MDINYIKSIIREMHEELVQRDKTFKNLIVSGKMTRDEANHRYICLQNAKWVLEADIKNELPKIPSDRLKSKEDVAAELQLEIKFRKRVYGSKVSQGFMTRGEMDRRLGYFEFAYTYLAPPVLPKVEVQQKLF